MSINNPQSKDRRNSREAFEKWAARRRYHDYVWGELWLAWQAAIRFDRKTARSK